MKLMIVGALGQLGQEVLRLALRDPRVEQVVVPAWRVFIEAPKLFVPVASYNDLPSDAPWWGVDSVICTLGTVRNIKETEEGCCRMHRDYPLAFAKLARRHGASTYVLHSVHGADIESTSLYYRLKGEAEHELTKVGFSSLSYIRPGLVPSNRLPLSERALFHALTHLEPVLPRELRLNPVLNVATALIESAVQPIPGVHAVAPKVMVC